MSVGAHPWSVKGIDPRAREAAREMARRQGMTLGEWLNQAILTQDGGPPSGSSQGQPGPQDFEPTLGQAILQEEDGPALEAWSLATNAAAARERPASGGAASDAVERLAKRLEASDKRTQLAVAGVDRALTTLDRSVLGLSDRIEDTENLARRAAEDLSVAKAELTSRLGSVEQSAHASLREAQTLRETASQKIEEAAFRAQEQALRATLPALNELRSAQNELNQKLASAESGARALSSATLNEVRALQSQLASAIADADRTSREHVATATAELRAAHATLTERIAQSESGARRIAETTMSDLRTLQSDVAARILRAEEAARGHIQTSLEDVRAQNRILLDRIEANEAATREATSSLRQAAGAAIADLRNAQLGLTTRIKQVEEASQATGPEAVLTLKDQQSGLRGQLEALQTQMLRIEAAATGNDAFKAALETLESRVAGAETATRSATQEAASALKSEIAAVATRVERLDGLVGGTGEGTIAAVRAAQEEVRQQISALMGHVQRLDAGMQAAGQAGVEAAKAGQLELRGQVEALQTQIQRIETASTDKEAFKAALDTLEMRLAGSVTATRSATQETAGLLKSEIAGIAAQVDRLESVIGGGGEGTVASVRTAQEELRQQITALFGHIQRLDAHVQAARTAGVEAAKSEQDSMRGQVGALQAQIRRLDEGLTANKAEGGTAMRALDESLHRLAERLTHAEANANTAIRTIEQSVAAIGEKADLGHAARAETEALRALVETRLDGMARQVADLVGSAREDLTAQLRSATEEMNPQGFEAALADVNRRLAAAERRQAQTIEAISTEIKRMSDTVDKRLKSVEERDQENVIATVRQEINQLSSSIAQRFSSIDHHLSAVDARFTDMDNREAAGFDRIGEEIGRVSERLEERFATVESRSAQAIEQVGEQVARMAERFNVRHDQMAREISGRLVEGEERAASRLQEAVSQISARLNEVDTRAQEAVTPVQKAMSAFASRLQALEDGGAEFGKTPSAPPPQRSPEPSVSAPAAAPPPMAAPPKSYDPFEPPMQAFQQEPVRAQPVTPARTLPAIEERGGAMDSAAERGLPPIEDSFARNAPAAEPEPAAFELEPFGSDLTDLSGPSPYGGSRYDDGFGGGRGSRLSPEIRDDYLNAVRRASQPPAGKAKRPERGAKAGAPGLRGGSKIVFWGAAGAVAAALAGAAYYVNANSAGTVSADAGEAPPEVDPLAPTEPAPLETAAMDPSLQTEPDPLLGTGATALALAPGGAAAATMPPTVPGVAPGARPAVPAAAVPGAAAPAAGAPAPARAQPVAATPMTVEQAASRGDPVAQYDLALQRLAANDAQAALSLLRSAANQGLAMAQYRLSKMYERGEGVPADLAQARQWTERAAAAGNSRAMHDLGVFFARGEGAPLDEAAAFRWFRQAAELGVEDSQFNLGVLYQQGRGTSMNPTEALFWFLVSAANGDSDARARSAQLEAQLSPSQVEQARARAQAFRPRAASARANGDFGPRTWAPS